MTPGYVLAKTVASGGHLVFWVHSTQNQPTLPASVTADPSVRLL
jgi:hypothetical protein